MMLTKNDYSEIRNSYLSILIEMFGLDKKVIRCLTQNLNCNIKLEGLF